MMTDFHFWVNDPFNVCLTGRFSCLRWNLFRMRVQCVAWKRSSLRSDIVYYGVFVSAEVWSSIGVFTDQSKLKPCEKSCCRFPEEFGCINTHCVCVCVCVCVCINILTTSAVAGFIFNLSHRPAADLVLCVHFFLLSTVFFMFVQVYLGMACWMPELPSP